MIARPAIARGSAAALASPITSFESAGSCTRKAMRRLVLARMSSPITPFGRCVASTRCTPRLRPRCATPSKAPMNDGCCTASVANSSITTTSRARPSSLGSVARIDRYDDRSVAPASRSSCSRRRSSASRLRKARSPRRSSRSVTTPTTWGRSTHASNVAPPL